MQKGNHKIYEHEAVPCQLIIHQQTRNKGRDGSPICRNQPRNASKTKKTKAKPKPHKEQSVEFDNQKLKQKFMHKLKDSKESKDENSVQNPYAEIYRNDLRYYTEYLESTRKNPLGGLNLKWPYYFPTY